MKDDFIWKYGTPVHMDSKWQAYFNHNNDIYRLAILKQYDIVTDLTSKTDYGFGWHRFDDNDYNFISFYSDSTDETVPADLMDAMKTICGIPDLENKLIGGRLYLRPWYVTNDKSLRCDASIFGSKLIDAKSIVRDLANDVAQSKSVLPFVNGIVSKLDSMTFIQIVCAYRQLRTLFVNNASGKSEVFTFKQNEDKEREIVNVDALSSQQDFFGGKKGICDLLGCVKLFIMLLLVVVAVVVAVCVIQHRRSNQKPKINNDAVW